MGDFDVPLIDKCRAEAGMEEGVYSHKTVRSISRNVELPSAFWGHWFAFECRTKMKWTRSISSEFSVTVKKVFEASARSEGARINQGLNTLDVTIKKEGALVGSRSRINTSNRGEVA